MWYKWKKIQNCWSENTQWYVRKYRQAINAFRKQIKKQNEYPTKEIETLLNN